MTVVGGEDWNPSVNMSLPDVFAVSAVTLKHR